MDINNSAQHNPLLSFMRQPKIYIKLPSRGQYWAPGSLEISATGEYPVYSMTARDELMLKIPDALMNGQAVVDVIQNCIPNVKDAWQCPSLDLDIILIAIRIATYGEMMTTPINFGGDLELEYRMDLRIVTDRLMNQISWDPAVPVNDNITAFVKPLNYKDFSFAAVQTFETQKIIEIVNNDQISEDDKLKLFKESFAKLTQVTIESVAKSIYKVDTAQGSTSDPVHIKQFMDNVDKEIFNKIQNHLDKLKEQNSMQPIEVAVTDEMREKGITGDTIKVPVSFDASTFFV